MKKKFLSLTFLSIVCSISAQTFLNGSFENTTSANSCNYNLTNANFNALMSNVNGFRSPGELDIVAQNCYIPSVPDGMRAVNIASHRTDYSQGDAIALELSTPMTKGDKYSITFDARSISTFGPQGNLLVGSSETNNSFGSQVYEAATVLDQWKTFTFTFTAPNNGSFITVRPAQPSAPNAASWNSVDNFKI